jgi:hypothetical protein
MKNSCCLALLLLLSLSQNPALAEETPKIESDMPLFVMLFDQHCKVWCSQVRTVLGELQQEFQGKAKYAELDTTPSKMKETMKQAQQLQIDKYVPDAMGNVPEVLVFTHHGKELVDEFAGVKDKKIYKASIEKAISKK